MRFCINCGKENKVTANFCTGCGKAMPQNKTEQPVIEKIKVLDKQDETTSSTNMKKKVAVITISILLFFLLIALYFNHLENKLRSDINSYLVNQRSTTNPFVNNQFKLQQKSMDSIKFEIIKATILFYGTDTSIYKNVNITTPDLSGCKVNDYQCLVNLIETKMLTGVANKINNWAKINNQTRIHIRQLKNTILENVIGHYNEYRKSLPSYSAYEKQLDTLVSISEKIQFVNQVPDSSYKPVYGDSSPMLLPISNNNTMGLVTWIALLIGLCGLGLAAWLYTRILKITSLNNTPLNSNEVENKVHNFHSSNTQLHSTYTNIQTHLQNRINILKHIFQKTIQKIKANFMPKTITSETIYTETLAFAKCPDLPDGFSHNFLKNEQNGELVFEISIRENTATYSISSNKNAQNYAINDYSYILGRACTMINNPFINCSIKIKEKGVLEKKKNGWLFKQKAIIEFV